jgi:hypothetical protein
MNSTKANREILRSLLAPDPKLAAWCEFITPYWQEESLTLDCPHPAIAAYFERQQKLLIQHLVNIIPGSEIRIEAPGFRTLKIKATGIVEVEGA